MNKKEILENVSEICNEIASSINYELVDVEFIKESGSYYLRVYIDKPGGINLDDCQKMSELLSEKLDEEDPISIAYFLEVSSPGLDRPLKTDKDLNRNIEKEVEISLYKPLEGKKMYVGKLNSFNDEFISINNEANELINIPRDTVSVVKLALKF